MDALSDYWNKFQNSESNFLVGERNVNKCIPSKKASSEDVATSLTTSGPEATFRGVTWPIGLGGEGFLPCKTELCPADL